MQMDRKKGGPWTIERCQKAAEAIGAVFLEDRYLGHRVGHGFQCKTCGYEWKTAIRNVDCNGGGCPKCAVLVINNCKTVDEYGHKLAKGNPNDIKYVGGYINSSTKAEWECGKGHVFETIPNKIQQGQGCPYCKSNGIKYVLLREGCSTIDEYGHKIAKENPNGIKYIGGFVNGTTKAEWECSKGHRWKATSNNIKKGSGCPYCNGTNDIKCVLFRNNCKTLDEYGHKIASESPNNIKYIGGFINTTTKAEWECSKGHRWEATPGGIKHKDSGCPYCNSTDMKHVLFRNNCKTLDQYGHKIAAESPNDIKYIRGLVGTFIKAEWECSQNHRWKATPNNIQQGTGCPKCAYCCQKNDLEYCAKIAEENGCECISKEYTNSETKLEWKCSKGHIWKATPTSIQQGYGCPYCSHQISKPQKEIAGYVSALVPNESVIVSDRKTISPMELDIWVPSRRKAVEYDGAYWHSSPESIERDRRKDRLCQEKGVELLRISDVDYLSNPEQIKKKIESFIGA